MLLSNGAFPIHPKFRNQWIFFRSQMEMWECEHSNEHKDSVLVGVLRSVLFPDKYSFIEK